MTHQFNTETSKRLMQMEQSTSQSTFRDSARQALMASKQVDGTLRIHTPFQELQSKKVANLKQKLTQLNSLSSSMRCQSGLLDSSEACSATAATASAPRRTKAGQQCFQYRPNSNISGLLDISNKPSNYQKPSYTTDLTRFSQNSLHKDLSPLRVQNLASNDQNRKSSKGRQAQLKYMGVQSAVQNPRRTNNMGNKYEDDVTSSIYRNRPIHDEYENKNRNSVSKERQHIFRSRSCPRSSSAQSLISNQSSPERLVNIVCPPSKGPKNRKAGQKIPTRTTRARSDNRQLFFNSFCSGDPEKRKQRMLRQVQAMGSSFGISASTSTQQQSNNLQQKKMMTPIKSKKQTMSRSGTKTKSQSHSRLGIYKNDMRNSCSSMGLSPTNKNQKSAKKQIVSRMSFSKHTPSKSYLLNRDASAVSHLSAQKSNRSWASASENSNVKHKRRTQQSQQLPYEVVIQQSETSKNPSRDDRRAAKYLKNQNERSNSIRKKFKFASLDPSNLSAAKRASSSSALKPSSRTRNENGQTTGKFQSFNEGNLKAMLFKSTNNTSNKKLQHVAFAQTASKNLATEDDFAETLTASSEESPERGPSQRVQRAAALTTKAYLEDVNYRLENANMHANHQLSIKEFGPRKMQAAYQGINKRQADRLQNLKEQMQESLIESHHLQSKLQTSGYDERGHGRGRGNEGVSQFNSLVLQFSQNLENMATDLIETTERKRKNLRMKEYIAEMQEIRRQQSQPRHHSGSYSRHGSAKRFSNSKRRSGSRSSRSNRSRSSRKGSIRKSSNKKNLSLKKRRLSNSKGKRKSKSKSKSVKRQKSARSARSRRSGASAASSRGRSRSRSLIKSVKRNIYKQTNGFRDLDNQPAANSVMHRPRQSRSRKRKMSRSQTKSKSRTRSAMNPRYSLTAKTQSRVKELAKKCSNLMSKKFNSVDKSAKAAFDTKLRKLRRSISRGKSNGRKSLKSKSRSKSNGKIMRKKTKSRKSRSKSVKKSLRSASKSPFKGNVGSTPNMNRTNDMTPNKITPCMTPLHNILRNTMGEHDGTDPRSGGKARFGPAMGSRKKVKIQSRRLRDVMQLSSSDSDSSYDSEDSLDNEMYLKRQQAHLSPWQRACLRKQLPKKFR